MNHGGGPREIINFSIFSKIYKRTKEVFKRKLIQKFVHTFKILRYPPNGEEQKRNPIFDVFHNRQGLNTIAQH